MAKPQPVCHGAVFFREFGKTPACMARPVFFSEFTWQDPSQYVTPCVSFREFTFDMARRKTPGCMSRAMFFFYEFTWQDASLYVTPSCSHGATPVCMSRPPTPVCMSRPLFLVTSHGKTPACMSRPVFLVRQGPSLYVTPCVSREITWQGPACVSCSASFARRPFDCKTFYKTMVAIMKSMEQDQSKPFNTEFHTSRHGCFA